MGDRNPSLRLTIATNGANDDDDRFLGDPLLYEYFLRGLDGFYALGLVVNWPARGNKSRTQVSQSYNAANYERFLSAVKTECFGGRTDSVFGLPFHALHITIASPYPARPTTESLSDRTNHLALATAWKKILLKASSSHDWPKRPLELELDSAQLGNRAGILLWKEHTGGIDKMRRCLKAAVNEESLSTKTSFNALEHFRIPDIIHTTFVRYHQQHREGTKQTLDIVLDDSNAPLLLRPSLAHRVLIERVVPNQALFTGRVGCGIPTRAGSSTGAAIRKVVVAYNVSFVNCKIYLLGPREEDHEVFLSLPLQDSKQTR